MDERFWSKVEKTADCWLWTAGKLRGYGRFWSCGRMVLSHRYVYETFNGPIPADCVVMHLCDTPSCVRPSHLQVGTQTENVRDMDNKRRRVQSVLKVPRQDIPQILQRAAAGESHASIARGYSVVPETVSYLVRQNAHTVLQ